MESADKQRKNSDKIVGRPFQKGVSGNPRGRPKGESLSESLKNIGDIPPPAKIIKDLGKLFPGETVNTLRQATLLRLWLSAARGSMKSIEILFDRLEGRAPVSEQERSDNRGMILQWIDSLK
jgi:hypothetical protein